MVVHFKSENTRTHVKWKSFVFLRTPVLTSTTSAVTCEWTWFVCEQCVTVAVRCKTEPIGTGCWKEISSRELGEQDQRRRQV